jgi:HAD superfamily hydrolase (TIGR01484 family)
MKPLSTLRSAQAAQVEVVFTDVDGTLTDAEGRIPAAVFAAMEELRAAGLAVVPVTGRPAGWCDLIARTWPIDGVIGENGGLYFRRLVSPGAERMLRIFAQSADTRTQNRQRLNAVADRILAAHPGAAFASDQRYRELDIAVDFCEDVPRLPKAEVLQIIDELKGAGCQVKLSNIHINAWFGSHDKAAMCLRYAADRWSWNLAGDDAQRCMFFGDSPNDSPLFALFPLSVGVANVAQMRDQIPTLPGYITEGAGAEGFVEGVLRLLELRSEMN